MGLRAYGGGDGIVKNMLYKKDLFHTQYDLNNKYQIRAEPKIVAFEVQRIFENTFKEILNKFKDLNKNIILTGGGALNILNNYKVLKYIKDTHNLYVDPMCEMKVIVLVQLYYIFNKTIQNNLLKLMTYI